jgi:hypothetical protein
MDRYLQQMLKNWVNQKPPPADGRARLLLLTASTSFSFEAVQKDCFEDYYTGVDEQYNHRRRESRRVFDLLWAYHSMPALRVA